MFEKVNVGGKKLDAFELVTAIYAAREFDLREDWDGNEAKKKHGRRRIIIGFPNRRDVLSELASTDFLQACTLVHTRSQREEKAKLGVVGKDLPAISAIRMPFSRCRSRHTALTRTRFKKGSSPPRTF